MSSPEPRSPVERNHIDMALESVKKGGNKHIVRRDDDDEKLGLLNVRAFFFLILWYIFSAFTLFLNKYILSTLKGDPAVLGAMQMVMTTTCGFIQLYLPLGFYKPVKRDGKPPHFWRNMFLVGTMRFSTVVLGLVALKFVAVSFTETVKSSAPLFTVFISQVLIGEHTGFYTFMSLIPIMSGLALCSAYELSFNFQGFIAALATNLTECLQNVYSKMLISGEKYKYTPAELQFYTSISSVVVQIPACFFLIDFDRAQSTMDGMMMISLVSNGVFFHFQSISAYVLMGYISPVTHSFMREYHQAKRFLSTPAMFHFFSVANTVKRAFLIWISVILFGNPVTFLSGLGTVIVTIGVLLYTKAKEYDHSIYELKQQYSREKDPTHPLKEV